MASGALFSLFSPVQNISFQNQHSMTWHCVPQPRPCRKEQVCAEVAEKDCMADLLSCVFSALSALSARKKSSRTCVILTCCSAKRKSGPCDATYCQIVTCARVKKRSIVSFLCDLCASARACLSFFWAKGQGKTKQNGPRQWVFVPFVCQFPSYGYWLNAENCMASFASSRAWS